MLKISSIWLFSKDFHTTAYFMWMHESRICIWNILREMSCLSLLLFCCCSYCCCCCCCCRCWYCCCCCKGAYIFQKIEFRRHQTSNRSSNAYIYHCNRKLNFVEMVFITLLHSCDDLACLVSYLLMYVEKQQITDIYLHTQWDTWLAITTYWIINDACSSIYTQTGGISPGNKNSDKYIKLTKYACDDLI